MGYHRSGFDQIVGVDIKPQPRYPFTFVLGDALEYVKAHGHEYDAIHASPPCQRYTTLRGMWNHAGKYLDLIDATRHALRATRAPWAIENVLHAPLARGSVMLCGTMFDLRTLDGTAELRRHRYFELRDGLSLVPECRHHLQTVGVYGNAGGANVQRPSQELAQRFATSVWREVMGIDWMTGQELSQAVPPAYCEFIGRQLLHALHA
jgi:DNA (cytosine-5)-methyltransferase 1